MKPNKITQKSKYNLASKLESQSESNNTNYIDVYNQINKTNHDNSNQINHDVLKLNNSNINITILSSNIQTDNKNLSSDTHVHKSCLLSEVITNDKIRKYFKIQEKIKSPKNYMLNLKLREKNKNYFNNRYVCFGKKSEQINNFIKFCERNRIKHVFIEIFDDDDYYIFFNNMLIGSLDNFYKNIKNNHSF
jgi:hypothetical protein